MADRPRETILSPPNQFPDSAFAPLRTLFKFIDQPEIWNKQGSRVSPMKYCLHCGGDDACGNETAAAFLFIYIRI